MVAAGIWRVPDKMVVLEVVVPVTLLPQVVEQQAKATQVVLEMHQRTFVVAVVEVQVALVRLAPELQQEVLVLPLQSPVQA